MYDQLTSPRRAGGTQQKRSPAHKPRIVRRIMMQEARNDEQSQRLIAFLYREGVTPENITRLLNYHYTDTFSCIKDSHEKSTIRRVPEGTNFAPAVEIWKQP